MNLILAATYACLSVYGSGFPAPAPDAGDTDARLEYREASSPKWIEAHPAWFDRRPVSDSSGNEVGGQEYRGSICGLAPNTRYEVRLTPAGAKESASASESTWADPDLGQVRGTVIKLEREYLKPVAVSDNKKALLVIKQGGTPDNWRIYEAHESGTVIDGAATSADFGIVINAPYVMLRGVTIRNVAEHGIVLGPNDEANDADLHDIIISGNDVSRWGVLSGKPEYAGYGRNADSAVYSFSSRLRRVTVQRNKFHEPNFGSNSWVSATERRLHPQGPHAITFNRNPVQDHEMGFASSRERAATVVKRSSDSARVKEGSTPGNHVIRYNEIWAGSEAEMLSGIGKKFNDLMGSLASNGSNTGFLIRDTDIHGNSFNSNWDDMIEGDGAYRNVRIWGNYFNDFFVAVSCQGVLGGPLYVWGNVFDASRANLHRERGGTIFKFDENNIRGRFSSLGGRVYVYNNASLDPTDIGGPMAKNRYAIWKFLSDGNRPDIDWARNLRAFNNIMYVDTRTGAKKGGGMALDLQNEKADLQYLNRVDYNLVSILGKKSVRAEGTRGHLGEEAVQSHGLNNTAVGGPKFNADYDGLTRPAFPTTAKVLLKGRYRLKPDGRGARAGLPIPGFTPATHVDLGPQQSAAADLEYGVMAYLAAAPETRKDK
ncbi:MAG: hypothetical protein ACT4QA_16805 [Panacagrimonas sp.]